MMRGVILAAGRGSRLGASVPKALVRVGQKRLIEYSLLALRKNKIKEVTIVTGYKGEQIEEALGKEFYGLKITYAKNPLYETSGTMSSVLCAKDYLHRDMLLIDADLFYDYRFLKTAILSPHPNLIVLGKFLNNGDDFYVTYDSRATVTGYGTTLSGEIAQDNMLGVFFGICKFSSLFVNRWFEFVNEQMTDISKADYHDILLSSFLSSIRVVPSYELEWCEVDTKEDLAHAEREVLPRLLHQFA